MVKIGLEKIFLKILPIGAIFLIRLTSEKGGLFYKINTFSNKNDHLSAWRDFKKILCGVCKYDI